MIDLPQEMRDLLVEQLDEYIEGATGSVEPDTLAQHVVDLLQTVADEVELEMSEDLVAALETSGDLDAPLVDLLSDQIEGDDLEEVSGEDLVVMLEKLCDVEWSDEEVDSYGVEELDEELDFDGEGVEDMEDEDF